MGKSKEVYNYMRRATVQAVQRVAWSRPEFAETLHKCAFDIETGVADIVSEDYRLMELADIFKWQRTRIKNR